MFFMAYPFMLLTISIIAGWHSIFNLDSGAGSFRTEVTYARTIRGSVLSHQGKRCSCWRARSLGTRNRVILLRHVFPNRAFAILVLGTVRVANIIIWESGLSFLGMGVPPPMRPGTHAGEGRVYITDAGGW